MKKPESLYAPFLGPTRRRRRIALRVSAAVLLAFLGLRVYPAASGGDDSMLWPIGGWAGLRPPPDPAESSAFGLVAAPPEGASAAGLPKHYRAEVERQPASPHAWQRLAAAAEAAGERAEARRARASASRACDAFGLP